MKQFTKQRNRQCAYQTKCNAENKEHRNFCHNELCICNRNCSKVFGSIAISFYKKQNSGNDTN